MTIKPIKETFKDQFWRELQASYKAGHSEEVKKQYRKHQDAVIVSLNLMNQKKPDGKR